MSEPVPIKDIFDTQRVPSLLTQFLLILYCPIGCVIFFIRIFLGLHTFLVACLLRKSTKLRTVVVRTMCALLGIVVWQDGSRAPKVKVMCANHVSALDHLAVDVVESCILPSVWDIPSILRWCFGYHDLGLKEGRDEFIRQARRYVEKEELPILSFPEGSITNGRVALLKFSTWPMEVSAQIQPISIKIWRPIDVRSALLGSSWYSDVFWFMFLPFTFIRINWLPVVTKNEGESVEEFAVRVSRSIANSISISTSNVTNQDAVEAAKRHARKTPVTRPPKRSQLDSRRLDEMAMRIKQSHPAIPVYSIRQDLERTMDPNETVLRIKSGKLTGSSSSSSGKMTTNPGDWKRLYESRKWDMIEKNRSRYLHRAQADMEQGDH